MAPLMKAYQKAIHAIVIAASVLLGAPALAQGTLPIALQQQFSFTGCNNTTGICGRPLAGGLLYFFQVGTVATQQNSFQDTGLTIPNPNPLVLDANGRIPIFYLANGSIHVRLTDSSGVVQFDIPSALVIGPSGGGGGGGSTVDPTTIASTGDVKWRPTTETLTGWVKLNGLTIGSATSGATGRANADTQALYIYLWGVCADAFCPVSGGRGATGLADFNANKPMATPDMRGRGMMALADMGGANSGRLTGGLFLIGNATSPLSAGGEAAHTHAIAEMPAHNHGVTDTHTHQTTSTGGVFGVSGATTAGGGIAVSVANGTLTGLTGINTSTTNTGSITTQNAGSSTAFNVLSPFMLGTFHMKL